MQTGKTARAVPEVGISESVEPESSSLATEVTRNDARSNRDRLRGVAGIDPAIEAASQRPDLCVAFIDQHARHTGG